MANKYFYVRVKSKNPQNKAHRGDPIACIASSGLVDGKVQYALSIVNPNDEFKKKLARKIAQGRLEVGSYDTPMSGRTYNCLVEVPESDRNSLGITKTILTDIVNRFAEQKAADDNWENLDVVDDSKRVPYRLRNAAKAWLKDYEKRHQTQQSES